MRTGAWGQRVRFLILLRMAVAHEILGFLGAGAIVQR